MSYGITVADIEARWRPLEASEKTVATALIEDAGAVLDSMRPTLSPLVADGKVPSRLVTSVLYAMVQRVLRNPDGLTGQAVEDISQNFAGPRYDGRLYVSDEELSMLDGAIRSAGGSVGSSGIGSFLPYAKALARFRDR